MIQFGSNSTLNLLLILVFTGCDDVDWPEPRYVDSLRVLGVQGTPPTLTPGATTELSMHCVNGGHGTEVEPSCQVEVAWFSQCNNPKENRPENCVLAYSNWANELSERLAETPPSNYPEGFGFGPTFHFKAPEDILQEKFTAKGVDIKYGTSYVFFAVCEGQLKFVRNNSNQLPVECLDTKTGKRLDHRRFVTGVTTVYSYDVVTTNNPVLINPRFDNVPIPANCNETSPCPEGFECSTVDHCVPVVQHCAEKDPEKCPEHCLSFELSADSFNQYFIDPPRDPAKKKFLWLSYLTNAGNLPADDANFALNSPVDPNVNTRTPCIRWQPPVLPTDQAHLWAVVRDNHGGFTTWDQRIIVR